MNWKKSISICISHGYIAKLRHCYNTIFALLFLFTPFTPCPVPIFVTDYWQSTIKMMPYKYILFLQYLSFCRIATSKFFSLPPIIRGQLWGGIDKNFDVSMLSSRAISKQISANWGFKFFIAYSKFLTFCVVAQVLYLCF